MTLEIIFKWYLLLCFLMGSVLLFEYISGGGVENPSDFKFLISEGFGMLSSLINDFSLLEYKIHTLIDERIIAQFSSTHYEQINSDQMSYTRISNTRQVPLELQSLIPKFDYILFIAPEFSNVLHDLIENAENLIEPHQTILSLPSKAISIFSDKLTTESYLSSLGYNAPTSLIIDLENFSPPQPNSEYIIKPIDGVGASETYYLAIQKGDFDITSVISNLVEKSSNRRFLLQEKINGIPLSVFVSSQNGTITYLTFNSQSIIYQPLPELDHVQQLTYLGGSTPFLEISKNVKDSIQEVASIICSQFQLTGFMGIDFLYNLQSNTFSIVDINPRVTTPYVAISQLFRENGFNLLDCLFKGQFSQVIHGHKQFKKDDYIIALD